MYPLLFVNCLSHAVAFSLQIRLQVGLVLPLYILTASVDRTQTCTQIFFHEPKIQSSGKWLPKIEGSKDRTERVQCTYDYIRIVSRVSFSNSVYSIYITLVRYSTISMATFPRLTHEKISQNLLFEGNEVINIVMYIMNFNETILRY